jgi:hypothetical protein
MTTERELREKQERYDKADAQAGRIASFIRKEFGFYAHAVIVDEKRISPMNNKVWGDLETQNHAFEISNSEKHQGATMGESKVKFFTGRDGKTPYFIFGAKDGPDHMIFWLVSKALVVEKLELMEKKSGKDEDYYIVYPELFQNDPQVIWGSSPEDVIRRFIA